MNKRILGYVTAAMLSVSASSSLFAQEVSDKDLAAVADSSGNTSESKNRVYLYPGFGASLVRNDLAPVFYINLGFKHFDSYEVSVNTSSYFFFEKTDGSEYKIYRNTFLNA
ncbi:MAG TPA: hypothetical protein VFW78_09645, partial [Bacteroidia bacterium]|nr:hypothetical protein [Bacteroidia bacterium]